MMSQTSANVDANVNPVYADVVKVKLFQDSTYPEMVTKGWGIGLLRISSEFLRIWLSLESAME